MIGSLGTAYAWLLGWPALARVNKALFYIAGRGLGLHNYKYSAISGEAKAIARCIGGLDTPIVFDVGANQGDWIALVMSAASTAKIHAFEPQEALLPRIQTRFPAVKVNNLAVGHEIGMLQLYDYADHSGSAHASLLAGVIDEIHRGKTRTTDVPVTTLDAYCLEHRIDRIDLLKIDVEGFELNVLRGARRLLAENRITAIQFEFNEMNVIGHSFLNDFIKILRPSHKVYRILPHGLMRLDTESHWFREQFVYQNIIALAKAVERH